MENIGILICQNYYKELKSVIRSNDFKNIKISTFAPHCAEINNNDCEKINEKYSHLKESSDLVKIFAPKICANCNENNVDPNNSFQKNIISCNDLFASDSFINQLISEGYYIVTPGWLANWKSIVIERWKFNSDTAKMFFSDTAKEVIVLDTGIYPDYKNSLSEFTEYIGLPYKIINIGIDFFQLKVEKEIGNILSDFTLLKNKKVINEKNRKLADYAMLFDIIPKIATIRSEYDVIESLTELLQMLLSPQEIVVAFLKSGKIHKITSTQDISNINFIEFENMFQFNDMININEENTSMRVKVAYEKDIYAYISINNILFPQYIDSYTQVLNIILSYLGLFISNARQHNTLIEAKNTIEENELKLLESNKTKDLFFSIIAHDLKSPFNAMLHFSEVLKYEYETSSEEEKKLYINFLHKGINETFNLLENLLYWASSQKGTIKLKLQEINIKNMVDKCIELFNYRANMKSIKLTSSTPDNTIVSADEDMLSTIIRNLISNAIKFTPLEGEVSIKSKITEINGKEYIEIKIKDTGLGIPEEKQKMLFKIKKGISTRGTANEAGTGLGLILCKDFVEKHGGDIWLKSEINKGTEISFTIPYGKQNTN